jgi:hypothetical protein
MRHQRLSDRTLTLRLIRETNAHLPRFPGMRIREENCNMVLLAIVACFSVAIAGGATLLGFDDKPVRFAQRTTAGVERSQAADQRIIHVGDQPPVRMIGATFIPNTNPREI